MPIRIPKPIKVIAHGKTLWQVSVPKKISPQRKRLFYSTLQAAKDKCAELTDELGIGAFGAAVRALSRDEQAAVVRALARVNNDTERLERAVELFLRSPESIGPIKMSQLADECFRSRELSNKSDAYLETFGVSMRHVKRRFGSSLCTGVTSQEIEDFIANPRWATDTRRGYLKDIRTLFNFAKSRGYCSHNPAEGVPLPTQDNRPPGILTVEECARYLATLLVHDRGLIRSAALSLFGGLRPSEAARGTDAAIMDGEFDVSETKLRSRRHRFITLNPVLKAWLDVGLEWYPEHNARRRWEVARAKAAVPWPSDCLRHSFASYHLAYYKDPGRTAHEMGHRSTQMLYQQYRNRVRGTDAEAFWRLTPERVARWALVRAIRSDPLRPYKSERGGALDQ